MNCFSKIVIALFVLPALSATAASDPQPLDQVPDSMGQTLHQEMIWAPSDAHLSSAYVAFRKKFSVSGAYTQAKLYLFADVRYMLWINGHYVLRGPARFNPKGPEYDTMDVKEFLHPGDNEIVALVLSHQSNGKMMDHTPCLTLQIDLTNSHNTHTVVSTDETWKWSDQTRYRTPHVEWGNLDDVIDSTVEDGDWTQPDYKDDNWKLAAKISGDQWGPLSARRIPLLRATPVEIKLGNNESFPITLSAGQELNFNLQHLVQAYTSIDFEADADSTFELPYAGISYKAKAGRQLYLTSDTHGFAYGSLKVISGKIIIYSLKPVELIYPFDCLGSFNSSDPLLNKLWSMCARSNQVMSEDAYVDCSDRERSEWMDNDPPDFDITRTAMAGPGENGAKVYSDPRLLKELLRRTALTLQPDGWVKAHTCSDRFDIHAKMEDRACDWVEGARRYYESTGDAAPIREIWPAIVSQMNYFLDRRSSRGLVIAREWIVWGNPIGYQTCEGAGINAFIYKALVDAAFLGKVIDKTDDADKFEHAAKDLSTAFDKILWDEKDGTYYSGYYTDPSELPPGVKNGSLGLPVTDHLIAPNVQAVVFALDQGIVPANRLQQATTYALTQPDHDATIMFYYYYFKQLYGANEPAKDKKILDFMRRKWRAMASSPWHTSWEEFNGGSHAHCYGMYPGYFLSSYVLGVRLDGPAANKRLLINPRLGDLAEAEGTVITEFGPVPVSWKMSSDHLDFQVQVPKGVTASLLLPSFDGKAQLMLDNIAIKSTVTDSSTLGTKLTAGTHTGVLTFPPQPITFVLKQTQKDFSDDFTKGDGNWQTTNGTWKADSGVFTQSDVGPEAMAGVKNITWSDATYTFSLKIDHASEPTAWAGIQFRKPDVTGSHTDGGYILYLRANGDMDLYYENVLQSIKTGLDTSKFIRCKVVTVGGHLQVYLNDETSPRIDVQADNTGEGFMGFICYHVQASFGPVHVEVSKLFGK
jgi:alpha-L-rhamnosidase